MLDLTCAILFIEFKVCVWKKHYDMWKNKFSYYHWIFDFFSFLFKINYNSSASKKWGYTGFGLSVILSFNPSKACFRSIPWEPINRIWPNFVYALKLTRSRLGLLHGFLAHLYQSYGPWFMPELCFSSISWEKTDRSSSNFIYAFILTRSRLGLLNIIFRTFVSELWPLI